MRQLERLLGAEQLRDGLRAYLKQFEFGNATWLDLVRVLDERTDRDLGGRGAVSGRKRPAGLDPQISSSSASTQKGMRSGGWRSFRAIPPGDRSLVWTQHIETKLPGRRPACARAV